MKLSSLVLLCACANPWTTAWASQSVAPQPLPGLNSSFVQFQSDAALRAFITAHPHAKRVHKDLLWAEAHTDWLGTAYGLASVQEAGALGPRRRWGVRWGSVLRNRPVTLPGRNAAPALPPQGDRNTTPPSENTVTPSPSAPWGLWTPRAQLNRELWGIRKVQAPQAWSRTPGKPNVLVAVIDTGINPQHRALKNQVQLNPKESQGILGKDDDGNGYPDDVWGFNTLEWNGNTGDDHGHGTHVAGTIAGRNDEDGFYGVAPGVKLLAVKSHNADGNGTEASVIKGVLYAVDRGVQVINASWSGAPEAPAYNPLLADAIAYAQKKGVLFVAAAGNDKRNNDAQRTFPSGYDLPNIISVAASDRADELPAFSNYGLNSVDIAAPGSGIYSAEGEAYDFKKGTSMAAPHVSGAAALIYSVYGPQGISALQVRQLLMQNARKVSSMTGKVASGGILSLGFLAPGQ